MSSDLPGFDFSKMDVLSAEKPRQISLAEASEMLAKSKPITDFRMFEVNVDGSVKTFGYTPDEVEQLLRHYREHMITFSRGMQELASAQSSVDAVRYSPDMTDEEIRERVRDL